jgi:nitroreductase
MNAAEAVSPSQLVDALNWRYAVKKFDPAGRVPADAWKALEDALVLSPSSYGLQAWKFFVVDDPALRARLRTASWGQSQVTDADKLVVFAVKRDAGAAEVERFVDRIVHVRGVSRESLEGYRQMMLRSLDRPEDERRGWLSRQVYIALGNFLTCAAALGVDACPMEGLDRAEYDRILGLREKGWETVVVAAVGARSRDDEYARAKKVRFEKPELVEHL